MKKIAFEESCHLIRSIERTICSEIVFFELVIFSQRAKLRNIRPSMTIAYIEKFLINHDKHDKGKITRTTNLHGLP